MLFIDGDAAETLQGLPRLSAFEQQIWQRAAPHLETRRNDNHSLFVYGIASALLQYYPEANPDVVLPAILLHDTGWSQVPEDEVLEAIAPGGGRKDLVVLHEQEGARIARDILSELDYPGPLIDEIAEIIDGHDSRLEALRLSTSRVHGYLFTNYGSAMAMALTSLESMAPTSEVAATLTPEPDDVGEENKD